MIEWRKRDECRENPWDGFVNDKRKYYVGKMMLGDSDEVALVADVAIDTDKTMWHDLNVPFESVAEAKQWCEMVEATGAY